MSAECSVCGQLSDPAVDGDPPLTWSIEIVETSGSNRTRWTCPTCTRRFVRSIEAKLDQQWW